jgi:hypothetical protein
MKILLGDFNAKLSREDIFKPIIMLITVVVLSKGRNVFARSNIRIVGSNPTQSMDVYLNFSLFVFSCVGSGIATG